MVVLLFDFLWPLMEYSATVVGLFFLGHRHFLGVHFSVSFPVPTVDRDRPTVDRPVGITPLNGR